MSILTRSSLASVLVSIGAACGDDESSIRSGPRSQPDAAAADASLDAALTLPSDAAQTRGDASSNAQSDAAGKSVVYAHSATQLYELDPVTKAVTSTRPFVGCSGLFGIPDPVTDLAIDGQGRAMCTTSGALFSLDLETARCTLVRSGSYPNSLSFVPKGALDANGEVLVGYVGSTYVRIDPSSGAVQNVGEIGGDYISSGDIVSVQGGGTFLTVKGTGCNDCLLQVDPATGALINNYGPIQHADVFGLAYWAGAVYGFDSAGSVFEIRAAGQSVAVFDLPGAAAAGRTFWGAGSSTSAPPTADDGTSIPLF